jgi:hypothetical protein
MCDEWGQDRVAIIYDKRNITVVNCDTVMIVDGLWEFILDFIYNYMGILDFIQIYMGNLEFE